MRRVSCKAIDVFVLAVIIVLPILAACGDAGAGPGPDDNAVVKAKAGSLYIYDNIKHYDNNVDDIRIDSVAFISADNVLEGMTGLLRLYSSANRDTSFARYEPNGDLTAIRPIDTDRDGVNDSYETTTMPFGSHARLQRDIDTTFYPGSGYTVVADSMCYAGNKNITVTAGSFSASAAVMIKQYQDYTVTGTPSWCIREVDSLYFAPSTGFIVKKISDHETLDENGVLQQRKRISDINLRFYRL